MLSSAHLFLALVILVVICSLLLAALLALRIWHRPELTRQDEFAPPPPPGSHGQFDVGGSWRGTGEDFHVAAANRSRT